MTDGATGGFCDRVLHVDLGTGTWEVERPGEAFFRRYGGGRAAIAHYLLERVPRGADPLGPDNVLVFAPGVATGVPAPGTGRHSVGARSPLTGAFGEAEAGGFWGAELKRAGWDAIVFHGASARPVYLAIHDDDVALRDASGLWGRPAADVEDAVRGDLGEKNVRIAQCGIAGENLVRFACVANDLNEVAGRTGLGAVMGSKKLKAIAVRGTRPVPVVDRAALRELAAWVTSTMDENHHAFHEYGTGAAMQGKDLEGGMPTHNHRLGTFPGTSKVDAIAIAETARIEMKGCFACAVRCKKVVRVERQASGAVDRCGRPIAVDPLGRWSVDPRYGGPEYEGIASFGPNVGVDDLVAVLKSNEVCNTVGLDVLSSGSTIAWAIECYERGVLTDADTGGIPLRYGDGSLVVRLLEMIARREGIGDLLAEGSRRASRVVGRGSERWLTTGKGLESAMHDPRQFGEVLAPYLLAPTGADHMRQQGPRNGLRNQIGLCHFLKYGDEQVLALLNATTGWGLTADDVALMARRGVTLARLFNVREGFTRADDVLPARFMDDLPRHTGITREQCDAIVSAYYAEHGWDDRGVPLASTLEELDIGITPAIRSVMAGVSG